MKVFVSYSHADSKWLERLKVHLRPLQRNHELDLWEDTRIRPGSKWRREIEKAIDTCDAAILLVSADFLASEFIANDEIPPLLRAAEDRGAIVMPVIVAPSLFRYRQELSQFQAVNDPASPLISLPSGGQEEIFVKVAEAIMFNSSPRADLPTSDNRGGVPAEAGESFLDREHWNRLITIGDWILDERRRKITGAGMNTFLLSRHDYSDFELMASLVFSNFSQYQAGALSSMNAGFVIGWQTDSRVQRYHNVLLTGEEVLLERTGQDGPARHLSERVPLRIEQDVSYQFNVVVRGKEVALAVDGTALAKFELPNRIVGRVGIRPWRCQIECGEFNVNHL